MFRIIVIVAFVASAFHFGSSMITETKAKVEARTAKIERLASY